LELLKHELACSDEHICSRLRTDLAVMDACGISEVQSDASSVLPLVDHVPQAIARVATGPTPAIRSLAGNLAFHEAS
jgi:hypothetical protein